MLRLDDHGDGLRCRLNALHECDGYTNQTPLCLVRTCVSLARSLAKHLTMQSYQNQLRLPARIPASIRIRNVVSAGRPKDYTLRADKVLPQTGADT